MQLGQGLTNLHQMLTGPGGTDARVRQSMEELQRLSAIVNAASHGGDHSRPVLGPDGTYATARASSTGNVVPVRLDSDGKLPEYMWHDNDECDLGRDYSRIFDDKLPTTPD